MLGRCRALLLASRPWHRPVALRSAWALYEMLEAVSAGVDLQVLLLRSGGDGSGGALVSTSRRSQLPQFWLSSFLSPGLAVS